jgi:hypothetical protein
MHKRITKRKRNVYKERYEKQGDSEVILIPCIRSKSLLHPFQELELPKTTHYHPLYLSRPLFQSTPK